MNCPFCAEEIKDDAVVCKHCRRDLAIVRPVLLELRAQAEQIAALKEEVQALRFLFETTSEPRPISIVVPVASGVTSDIAGVAIGLISALLVLLAAHYVIIWELDLDRRWLLGATVIVPYLPHSAHGRSRTLQSRSSSRWLSSSASSASVRCRW